MNYWLFLIPLISALLGWICSWISGNILVHKIFPARREALALAIGKAASESFSVSDIEKKISDPENIKKVMPVVEAHVDDFLRHKLKEKMPMIGMLIGDKTINSLKEVFLKEIEDMFPQVMNKFTGNLKNEFDIQTLVTARVNAITPAQLQKMISPVLQYICLSGALIGLIIGLVNVLLVSIF